MDFRLQKLRLALWILAVGMVVSLLYHGWQGWVLGKSYPFNTFLCFPQGRYDDFTNCYRFTIPGDPYSYPQGGANYFPAAFLIFEMFTWLPPVPAAIWFLNLCTVGLFVVLNAALRPLLPQPGRRMLAAIILLWTYPFIYGLDRGNNEILLVLLVAASLFFFGQKRFTLSFLFLLPAICFKLYPAILLLLFFRHRLFHWFFIGIFGFVLVSWLVVLTFPGTIYENYEHFLHQMFIYSRYGILGNCGVASSASAWNLCRLIVWLVYFRFYHQPEYVGQLPLEVSQPALEAYYAISLSGLVLLTLYVLLMETSFLRRAILLLLYLTVSAPGGGDYKIMYVSVALIALLLIRERRLLRLDRDRLARLLSASQAGTLYNLDGEKRHRLLRRFVGRYRQSLVHVDRHDSADVQRLAGGAPFPFPTIFQETSGPLPLFWAATSVACLPDNFPGTKTASYRPGRKNTLWQVAISMIQHQDLL